MTDKKHAEIIDLKSRQDSRDSTREEIGELLAACRSISLKYLGNCLGKLFERADDALFDYGEKADTNAQQMEYFDSMRELRRKRAVAEREFQQEMARGFASFTTHQRRTAASRDAEESEDELSLVGEEELEETLAITNMVNKAENRYAQDLNALNQRLAVLAGGSQVENKSNPAGPGLVCEAFRTASGEFDLDTRSRLILFKLFDRYVIEELGDFYSELNKLLIDAGVLPQIKTPVRRREESQKPAEQTQRGPDQQQPAGGRQGEGHGAPAPGGGDAAEGDGEVMHTIRDLLASRHEGGQQDPSGQYQYNPFDDEALMGQKPTGNAYYAHLDLINALAVLQGEIARSARSIQPGAVSEIKDQLIGQVRKLTDSAKSQEMSSSDEDTIDLVGMLFEFILTDRNLPDTIQAVLSRLQIPYLKIALEDRGFFAQRAHPARRLLDDMAKAGIGWTPDNDKDNKLLDKIREIVDRILNDFDDDLDLFEELAADFEEFMTKYRRVAEVAERRTTEATRGRERLHQARKKAAREILSRLESEKLPEVAQNLLARPWANVLVLTLLRHGEDSQEWNRALKVADDVIWALKPKPSEAERMELIELVHPLCEAIREGLALVALHEDEVEQLLEDLTECFETVLNHDRLKSARRDPGAEAAQAGPDWMAQIEEEEAVEEEAPAASTDEYVQAVKEIPLGTWMEFADEEGDTQRAKLSWISPISYRYLFVNQKGIKIADRTREQLAMALRDGQARVLDDVPLFDRALDAIAERLQNKADSPARPS